MTAHKSFPIALAVVVAASAAVGTAPHPLRRCRQRWAVIEAVPTGCHRRPVLRGFGGHDDADDVRGRRSSSASSRGCTGTAPDESGVSRFLAGSTPVLADRDDLVVIIVDPVAGVRLLAQSGDADGVPDADGQSAGAVATIPQPASAFTEALGTSTMEGISVTGRRAVTTLPSGTDGRPVEIVDERWESAALGIALLERHRDSRTGVFEHRLTNLSRTEPPAALFAVPATYAVVDVVAAARR